MLPLNNVIVRYFAFSSFFSRYLSGNIVFPGEDRSQLIDVWATMNPLEKGLTFSALDKNLTKRVCYSILYVRCNIDTGNHYGELQYSLGIFYSVSRCIWTQECHLLISFETFR